MESQHRGGDSEEGRLETEKLLDRLADLLRGNPERIRRFQEYLEEQEAQEQNNGDVGPDSPSDS